MKIKTKPLPGAGGGGGFSETGHRAARFGESLFFLVNPSSFWKWLLLGGRGGGLPSKLREYAGWYFRGSARVPLLRGGSCVLGGGGVGTRPWWLALLACGGAYWPLALEPSAMTSRHPHCRGHMGGG